MEFGLDKLLVMLEERFGRRPTTALLFTIGVTLLVYCLNTLWGIAGPPITLLVGWALEGEIRPAIIEYLPNIIAGATGMAVWAIAYYGWIRLAERRANKNLSSKLEEMKSLRSEIGGTHDRLTELLSDIHATDDRLKNHAAELYELVQGAQSMVKAIRQREGTAPQSLPSTEPEKQP